MKKTKAPSAKKKTPDRIEQLVRKHLANIEITEDTFRSACALLEKYQTKYPELEQYVNVSPDDRSIQIGEDVKDENRAYHHFKIEITGVAVAYQVTHPGEEDHKNVDQADWTLHL